MNNKRTIVYVEQGTFYAGDVDFNYFNVVNIELVEGDVNTTAPVPASLLSSGTTLRDKLCDILAWNLGLEGLIEDCEVYYDTLAAFGDEDHLLDILESRDVQVFLNKVDE